MTQIDLRPARHVPNPIVHRPESSVQPTELHGVTLVKDTYFSVEDGWGIHYRRVLTDFAARQDFGEKPIELFEFGSGSGINLVLLVQQLSQRGLQIGRVTANDVRLEMLDGTNDALGQVGVQPELIKGGAIELLTELYSPERQLSGIALACLPQAPLAEGMDVADGYSAKDLPAAAQEYNLYGLGLNAGLLIALRQHAADDLNLLMVLSDRVPENIKLQMFEALGWDVVETHKTAQPVNQDVNTDIRYVDAFDDGHRFYADQERTTQITAIQARKLIEKGIPVYHDVTVYVLRPPHERRTYEKN